MRQKKKKVVVRQNWKAMVEQLQGELEETRRDLDLTSTELGLTSTKLRLNEETLKASNSRIETMTKDKEETLRLIRLLRQDLNKELQRRCDLRNQIDDLRDEILARRRVAAVFATFFFKGKSIEEAILLYMALADEMGYDLKDLRVLASEALKTAGRQLHRIAFEGLKKGGVSPDQELQREIEMIAETLGVSKPRRP